MNFILNYVSDEEEQQLEEHLFCDVGGNGLANILASHPKLKDIHLNRDKRSFKKKIANFVVDDEKKEDFSFISVKGAQQIKNKRNRLSDELCLTEDRREKCTAVKNGIDADVELARWTFYCPGQGNCRRACGGCGRCTEGCGVSVKRHSRHCCSIQITAKIHASGPTRLSILLKGAHVPHGTEWHAPTKNKPIAEHIEDDIMKDRASGLTSFNIYRRQLAGIDEPEMTDAFNDTRLHPVPERVSDFIKITEKRHSFQSGQWLAVYACMPQLKLQGKLLLYQEPNVQVDAHDIEKPYNLCISNQTALKSARINQHVIGIDGKHGLQDDGACLTTCVTQHKDGFGCPTAFSLINRENTDSVMLTLQAIIDNVPCDETDCSHDYQYSSLPGQHGYKRYTPCSALRPYKPFVMIDKHEPSQKKIHIKKDKVFHSSLINFKTLKNSEI